MFDRVKHLREIAAQAQQCECKSCGRLFQKSTAFGSHIKMHGLSPQAYYDKYELKDKKDKFCACGRERVFLSILKGYGHMCSTKCVKAKQGENNPNHGKRHSNMHTAEFKKKQRHNMLGKQHSLGKGKPLDLTEEQREVLRQRVAKVNAKGFENKGGRCKWFEFNGIKAQGRWELAYLIYLETKGMPLPIRCDKRHKTPFGRYCPDFEFEDKFVEVKSSYTFETCRTNGQYEKICWLSDNVKPVEMIVLDEPAVNALLEHYQQQN